VGSRLVAKGGGGDLSEQCRGLLARLRGAAFEQVEHRGGGAKVAVAEAFA
jgi:hypothetical protein